VLTFKQIETNKYIQWYSTVLCQSKVNLPPIAQKKLYCVSSVRRVEVPFLKLRWVGQIKYRFFNCQCMHIRWRSACLENLGYYLIHACKRQIQFLEMFVLIYAFSIVFALWSLCIMLVCCTGALYLLWKEHVFPSKQLTWLDTIDYRRGAVVAKPIWYNAFTMYDISMSNEFQSSNQSNYTATVRVYERDLSYNYVEINVIDNDYCCIIAWNPTSDNTKKTQISEKANFRMTANVRIPHHYVQLVAFTSRKQLTTVYSIHIFV